MADQQSEFQPIGSVIGQNNLKSLIANSVDSGIFIVNNRCSSSRNSFEANIVKDESENSTQPEPFRIAPYNQMLKSLSMVNQCGGHAFPRCSSLKSSRTPPGTPSNKGVRFADAFGLDLTTVKHIFNVENPPNLPESATKYLQMAPDPLNKCFSAPSFSKTTAHTPSYYTKKIFQPCFPQPGLNANFLRRVSDNNVCLEQAKIDENNQLEGLVRVQNISFHKSVTVRVSENNWSSYVDVPANYMPTNSAQSQHSADTDQFSFRYHVSDTLAIDDKVQFAIRYETKNPHQSYWDNNFGKNYVYMMMEIIKENPVPPRA